jgi:hypothetical protein
MVAMDGPDKKNLLLVIKRKFFHWAVLTADPLLFILHLTIIYVAAVKADIYVLKTVRVSFTDFVSQSRFAANLLYGMKLFSVIAFAFAYVIHLGSHIVHHARHVIKVSKNNAYTLQGEDHESLEP